MLDIEITNNVNWNEFHNCYDLFNFVKNNDNYNINLNISNKYKNLLSNSVESKYFNIGMVSLFTKLDSVPGAMSVYDKEFDFNYDIWDNKFKQNKKLKNVDLKKYLEGIDKFIYMHVDGNEINDWSLFFIRKNKTLGAFVNDIAYSFFDLSLLESSFIEKASLFSKLSIINDNFNYTSFEGKLGFSDVVYNIYSTSSLTTNYGKLTLIQKNRHIFSILYSQKENNE